MRIFIAALTLGLAIAALSSHDVRAAAIAPQMSCPSCEDYNACTVDTCDTATGTCRHDPLDCDDHNPCTADTCTPYGDPIGSTLGCHHLPRSSGTACDDGAPCTTGDICDGAGHCAGQPQPSGSPCDDGNPCTAGDICDASGTCAGAALPVGTECDDHNACTRGERCIAGTDGLISCQGPPAACDDGNPCTTDSCNPITGDCIHAPLDCSDGNPCTDDACDPATGACVRTVRTGSCDDGNVCTVSESCVDGNCVGGTATSCGFPPTQCGSFACFPFEHRCLFFLSGPQCPAPPQCMTVQCVNGFCQSSGNVGGSCDDGNPCSEAMCVRGTCTPQFPLTGPCDDKSLCTVNDVCQGGRCSGTPQCSDGDACTDDACDPSTGACLGHTPVSCDDGNPCTTDSCDPAAGCVHTPNNDPCDDHNACTANDHCSNGQCFGTTAVTCQADNNPCTDDVCNPSTGTCLHINNFAPCNDGNPCTLNDHCQNGTCQPGFPPFCDDSNVCTADTCDPATGACVHTPVSAPCSDGNACTGNDTCVNGVCTPGAPLNCDDGNPCTTDGCTTLAGCYHVAASGPCDDRNPCTTGDTCVNGVCTPSAPVSCIDGNACTIDYCDRATGACVHQTAGGDCDDGDACTVDECDPGTGTCLGHHPLDCDDQDACTADSCDPSSGCHHVFTCPQEVRDITLAFGSAFGKGSGTLSWSTNGELILAGFNVVTISPQGAPTRVNPVTIPCTECVTGLGASYVYIIPKHKGGQNVFVQTVGKDGAILGTFGPAQKAP